jgi:hypothetical protein
MENARRDRGDRGAKVRQKLNDDRKRRTKAGGNAADGRDRPPARRGRDRKGPWLGGG